MFDIDKGLRGSIIHHKPLTDFQLKRLLLIFDELHFTLPKDNIYFLEKGSISYRYQIEQDHTILYSMDGHRLLNAYSHLKEPELKDGQLAVASIIRGARNSNIHPFDPIVLTDVLPYFKGEEFQKQEERLFDKFEKAVNKDFIKFIDYKNTDFNITSSISLKIAYDYDVNDKKLIDLAKPLFVDEDTKTPNMFIPSPPLPELTDFSYFPQIRYTSNFDESEKAKKFDYQRQFFSIVAKINKKLALTEKFDLLPVIIDDSIHNIYQYKIQKSKQNGDENFNDSWESLYNYKLMNLNNLIFKSSNIFIKDEQLKEISIPEILVYKQRCISDLYKLRKGLFAEINNIIKADINSNDLTEIDKLIGGKIIPELNKYQDSQNSIISKILGSTLEFSVAVGANYLGFVQGLSPMLISLLSGASPILTEKMLQLSGKLKDKRKRKYENTFSYFLNLNE